MFNQKPADQTKTQTSKSTDKIDWVKQITDPDRYISTPFNIEQNGNGRFPHMTLKPSEFSEAVVVHKDFRRTKMGYLLHTNLAHDSSSKILSHSVKGLLVVGMRGIRLLAKTVMEAIDLFNGKSDKPNQHGYLDLGVKGHFSPRICKDNEADQNLFSNSWSEVEEGTNPWSDFEVNPCVVGHLTMDRFRKEVRDFIFDERYDTETDLKTLLSNASDLVRDYTAEDMFHATHSELIWNFLNLQSHYSTLFDYVAMLENSEENLTSIVRKNHEQVILNRPLYDLSATPIKKTDLPIAVDLKGRQPLKVDNLTAKSADMVLLKNWVSGYQAISTYFNKGEQLHKIIWEVFSNEIPSYDNLEESVEDFTVHSLKLVLARLDIKESIIPKVLRRDFSTLGVSYDTLNEDNFLQFAKDVFHPVLFTENFGTGRDWAYQNPLEYLAYAIQKLPKETK